MCNIVPLDGYRTGIGGAQPRENFAELILAVSVNAGDTEYLAASYRERDLFQRRRAALVFQ